MRLLLDTHVVFGSADPTFFSITRDPFDRLLLTQFQLEGLRHPLAFLA
jgi:PIN domain nuclease of toxin-antitoxin system